MRRTPIIMAAIAVAAATTLGVTTLNDHDDAAPSAPAASDQDASEPSNRTVLNNQVKRQKELRDAAIHELAAEVDKRAESLRKAQNDAP